MAADRKFPYQSDITIRGTHPTDVSVDPHNPLDNTVDGATSTFKVYDRAANEKFSAAEALGQTVWSVTNAAKFAVDDIIEATETDGTILSGAVTAVDPTLGTITSDTALLVGAAAGARIRVRLGAQITMTEYGTPSLNTITWGFQGMLPYNHPGLDLDVLIDVEIRFVGGAGLRQLRVICAIIKPVEECE